MANEENAANNAATNKSANDTSKTAANANQKVESKGPVKEYFQEKGQESLDNLQRGGKMVTVNLTNKTLVEFIKDYMNFKKGHVQELSDVAFAIYDKKKVIKKL